MVEDGDTMSSIALRWFGEEAKWDLIAKANPLVDPARLRIGQKLRLPAKDTVRSARPVPGPGEAGPRTYTVGSGDTLSSIAEAVYGSANEWERIFDANRATIGGDPDDLRVGMRLTIPAGRGTS